LKTPKAGESNKKRRKRKKKQKNIKTCNKGRPHGRGGGDTSPQTRARASGQEEGEKRRDGTKRGKERKQNSRSSGSAGKEIANNVFFGTKKESKGRTGEGGENRISERKRVQQQKRKEAGFNDSTKEKKKSEPL